MDGWGISREIAQIWMSLDFTDDQSTLVQVMAWCRQATGHYLSQCWPKSLSPYDITRPQWVIPFIILGIKGDWKITHYIVKPAVLYIFKPMAASSIIIHACLVKNCSVKLISNDHPLMWRDIHFQAHGSKQYHNSCMIGAKFFSKINFQWPSIDMAEFRPDKKFNAIGFGDYTDLLWWK